MVRTEEQLRAISKWNEKDVADYRRFLALPDDAVGLDGIRKDSCIVNGWDTVKKLGITEENGFTENEVDWAVDRFTLSTARLFELV